MSTPIQRQALAEKHKRERAIRNKQQAGPAKKAPKKTVAAPAVVAPAAAAVPAKQKTTAKGARLPKAALAVVQAPPPVELKVPRKKGRLSRGVVARRWVAKLHGKWSNCRLMHMKHINDLVRSFAVDPDTGAALRINEEVFPIAYCILDHRIKDILSRVKNYMTLRGDTEVRDYHVQGVLALMGDA